MQKLFTVIETTIFSKIDILKSYTCSQYIVQFFYISLLYLMLSGLLRWQGLLSAYTIGHLWPVVWLQYIHPPLGIHIIYTIFLLGSIAAAAFSESKLARILVFIGFFQYAALINSFGKINHGLHLYVLVAFIFIFLPTGIFRQKEPSSDQQKNYLFIIFFAQAIILLSYTMAGIDKVITGIIQTLHNQQSIFSPPALSYQIAATLVQNNTTTLLGGWMIQNLWLGWVLFWGAMYLEAVSLWILFKPSLQKFWALGIIGMHIGIYLTLGIPFWENVFLIAILFFYSPFAHSTNIINIFYDIPLFGFLLKKLK